MFKTGKINKLDQTLLNGLTRRGFLGASAVAGVSAMIPASADAAFGQQTEGDDRCESSRSYVPIETRSLAELYQAAQAEGGHLTVYGGGDATNQLDGTKDAFLAQFPAIKLDLRVDLSKYHDARIDLAFAEGTTVPDVAQLQTLQDFPRWKRECRLLAYKPLGWDKVYSQFKDPDGAWTATGIYVFTNLVNTKVVSDIPRNFEDYIDPRYKDQLVFLYPNDDDAVCYLFYTAIEEHGWKWFEALLANKPEFVRGAARTASIVYSGAKGATFSTGGSLAVDPQETVQFLLPTDDKFLAWGQRSAIFKQGLHPHAAKLWMSWNLQPEAQAISEGWSVRDDATPPTGLKAVVDYDNAGLKEFPRFMEQRDVIERFRTQLYFYIGNPQGPDPATTYTSPS
jgi:ABC-type Fe3+ transport system substrate-binding protein